MQYCMQHAKKSTIKIEEMRRASLPQKITFSVPKKTSTKKKTQVDRTLSLMSASGQSHRLGQAVRTQRMHLGQYAAPATAQNEHSHAIITHITHLTAAWGAGSLVETPGLLWPVSRSPAFGAPLTQCASAGDMIASAVAMEYDMF